MCDFRLTALVFINGLIVQSSGKLSPRSPGVMSKAILISNINTLASVFTRAVNQSIKSPTVPGGTKYAAFSVFLT